MHHAKDLTTLNHIVLDQLDVDQDRIRLDLENIAWEEIGDPNRSTKQFYKSYEPDWLTRQLKIKWHSMGFLYAIGPHAYLEPHVDYMRSCAIVIPCSASHTHFPLDFWDIPQWDGDLEKNIYFNQTMGTKKSSIFFDKPILLRNIPHGVDNTQSHSPRINLSVCFLPPISFEQLAEMYFTGDLFEAQP